MPCFGCRRSLSRFTSIILRLLAACFLFCSLRIDRGSVASSLPCWAASCAQRWLRRRARFGAAMGEFGLFMLSFGCTFTAAGAVCLSLPSSREPRVAALFRSCLLLCGVSAALLSSLIVLLAVVGSAVRCGHGVVVMVGKHVCRPPGFLSHMLGCLVFCSR